MGHVDDTAGMDKGRLAYSRLTDVVLHPEYMVGDHADVKYDIAPIALPFPAPLSDTVQPISLPKEYRDYTHVTVTVLGWGGRTPEQAKTHNQVPKYTFMKVVNGEACKRDIGKWPREVGDEFFLCAMHSPERVCSGDFGGSLVYDDRGTYVLIGVTALGDPECRDPKGPQGFVRVSKHFKWIDKVVHNHKKQEQWGHPGLGDDDKVTFSVDRCFGTFMNRFFSLLLYLKICTLNN